MAFGCGGGNSSIYSWSDAGGGGGGAWRSLPRRSQRNSSCIVSASAPLVGVDDPLPDFSPNFHIFAWAPKK